jgi:hypothetical protein
MHRMRTRHGMRLTTALAILGVVSAAACADRTVAPEQEPVVPFAIGAAQRATLGEVLRFATRNESLAALTDREARAQVADAFARLSDRVAQNDRGGARRAIAVAREALRIYRERAGSDLSALLELETMALVLDHAEMLAGDAPGDKYEGQ